MNKLSGVKVASRGETISVDINEEVVNSVARTLAITLTLSNDSVSQVLSREQAEECFAYALNVILSQDSGAKPSHELVPTFLSDITMSLSCLYRGVNIHVSPLKSGERPDSYAIFLDVLTSLGIPTGKVLKVDPTSTSNVLKIGLSDFGGTYMLVGVEGDVSIEELVVRSMIAVQEAEQDKLTRIIGYMDNMYMSRDELVRQWACSLPVAKRS